MCRPKVKTAEASANKGILCLSFKQEKRQLKRLHSLLAAQLFALKVTDLVISRSIV